MADSTAVGVAKALVSLCRSISPDNAAAATCERVCKAAGYLTANRDSLDPADGELATKVVSRCSSNVCKSALATTSTKVAVRLAVTSDVLGSMAPQHDSPSSLAFQQIINTLIRHTAASSSRIAAVTSVLPDVQASLAELIESCSFPPLVDYAKCCALAAEPLAAAAARVSAEPDAASPLSWPSGEWPTNSRVQRPAGWQSATGEEHRHPSRGASGNRSSKNSESAASALAAEAAAPGTAASLSLAVGQHHRAMQQERYTPPDEDDEDQAAELTVATHPVLRNLPGGAAALRRSWLLPPHCTGVGRSSAAALEALVPAVQEILPSLHDGLHTGLSRARSACEAALLAGTQSASWVESLAGVGAVSGLWREGDPRSGWNRDVSKLGFVLSDGRACLRAMERLGAAILQVAASSGPLSGLESSASGEGSGASPMSQPLEPALLQAAWEAVRQLGLVVPGDAGGSATDGGAAPGVIQDQESLGAWLQRGQAVSSSAAAASGRPIVQVRPPWGHGLPLAIRVPGASAAGAGAGAGHLAGAGAGADSPGRGQVVATPSRVVVLRDAGSTPSAAPGRETQSGHERKEAAPGAVEAVLGPWLRHQRVCWILAYGHPAGQGARNKGGRDVGALVTLPPALGSAADHSDAGVRADAGAGVGAGPSADSGVVLASRNSTPVGSNGGGGAGSMRARRRPEDSQAGEIGLSDVGEAGSGGSAQEPAREDEPVAGGGLLDRLLRSICGCCFSEADVKAATVVPVGGEGHQHQQEQKQEQSQGGRGSAGGGSNASPRVGRNADPAVAAAASTGAGSAPPAAATGPAVWPAGTPTALPDDQAPVFEAIEEEDAALKVPAGPAVVLSGGQQAAGPNGLVHGPVSATGSAEPTLIQVVLVALAGLGGLHKRLTAAVDALDGVLAVWHAQVGRSHSDILLTQEGKEVGSSVYELDATPTAGGFSGSNGPVDPAAARRILEESGMGSSEPWRTRWALQASGAMALQCDASNRIVTAARSVFTRLLPLARRMVPQTACSTLASAVSGFVHGWVGHAARHGLRMGTGGVLQLHTDLVFLRTWILAGCPVGRAVADLEKEAKAAKEAEEAAKKAGVRKPKPKDPPLPDLPKCALHCAAVLAARHQATDHLFRDATAQLEDHRQQGNQQDDVQKSASGALGFDLDPNRLPGAVAGDTPRGGAADDEQQQQASGGRRHFPAPGAGAGVGGETSATGGLAAALGALRAGSPESTRLEAPEAEEGGVRWTFHGASAVGELLGALPCWARAHGVLQLLLAGTDAPGRPGHALLGPSPGHTPIAPSTVVPIGGRAATAAAAEAIEGSKVSLRTASHPAEIGAGEPKANGSADSTSAAGAAGASTGVGQAWGGGGGVDGPGQAAGESSGASNADAAPEWPFKVRAWRGPDGQDQATFRLGTVGADASVEDAGVWLRIRRGPGDGASIEVEKEAVRSGNKAGLHPLAVVVGGGLGASQLPAVVAH